MPLHPDDTVCFCFHVPLRKIETFCAVEQPQHTSQISDCLSAGTGCGWCVPMLTSIHHRLCANQQPWWRQPDAATDANVRADESVDAEAYQAGRKNYIQGLDHGDSCGS